MIHSNPSLSSSMDPRLWISRHSMSALQVGVIVIAICLQAVDGFCVLAISFAAPGIAADLRVDPARLGVVLSMELIGMAIGAILVGSAADRYGRRPTTLACLVVTALGMLVTARTDSVLGLCIVRLVTGLGIGGMVTCATTLAAEFANARNVNLAVMLTSIGYPAGSFLGGIVVARLLRTYSWHSVFYFGGTAAAAVVPFVVFFTPETVHWLVLRRPRFALQRVNRTLQRMGSDAILELPEQVNLSAAKSPGIKGLFGSKLLSTTVLLAGAYALQMLTTFFMLKWVAKIVADMGHTASEAAGVFVWYNLGGVLGGVILGFVALRVPIKTLTAIMMILSAASVTVFGFSSPNLFHLSLTCALAGFCVNAAVAGMYPLFSRGFPTQLRASGTGFATGIGRGVSAVSSVLTGIMFSAGLGVPVVASTMALGSLLAGVAVLMLKIGEVGA